MGFLSLNDSGTSIESAWGRDLPVRTRNSSTLSSEAESLLPGSITGKTFLRSFPKRSVFRRDSLVCIHSRLPLIVLISPLCARYLKGWARSHVGKVLVLKRECTSAIALVNLSSHRSGK